MSRCLHHQQLRELLSRTVVRIKQYPRSRSVEAMELIFRLKDPSRLKHPVHQWKSHVSSSNWADTMVGQRSKLFFAGMRFAHVITDGPMKNALISSCAHSPRLLIRFSGTSGRRP